MKTDRIKDAIFEAQRFIDRAKALVSARGKLADDAEYDHPVEQGSLKRASLDLTRSIAVMRRRT